MYSMNSIQNGRGSYHSECLKCNRCSRQIPDCLGQKISSFDQRLLCLQCEFSIISGSNVNISGPNRETSGSSSGNSSSKMTSATIISRKSTLEDSDTTEYGINSNFDDLYSLPVSHKMYIDMMLFKLYLQSHSPNHKIFSKNISFNQDKR